MNKKVFTDKEIKILSQTNIRSVRKKGITYTDESKRITENEKGKLPREVFKEYGFDKDIIEIKSILLQEIYGVNHIKMLA